MAAYRPAKACRARRCRRMADLAHVVGGDLQLGPSGDLAVVGGDDETRQRVLHRLLTSPGTYIWQLPYGAGLPALVGGIASRQRIAAIVRAQMVYEVSVAAAPEPSVVLAGNRIGAISATITYTDAGSGNSQVLTLPIGG